MGTSFRHRGRGRQPATRLLAAGASPSSGQGKAPGFGCSARGGPRDAPYLADPDTPSPRGEKRSRDRKSTSPDWRSPMCHDPGATPAIFGEAVTDASAQRLTLRSADGSTFSAYLATPARSVADAGVIVLPDVRGLHPYYERLAE